MIIHLIINGVFGVLAFLRRTIFSHSQPVRLKEKLQKKSIALTVLAVMVTAILTSAGLLVDNALRGETNYDLLTPYIYPCEEISKDTPSARTAVLRIDDVQAHAWSDISKLMIEDAVDRDMQPVLGIIPHNIESDRQLYGYLRSVRCNVEFAVHGWDNRPQEDGTAEFHSISESEASSKLRKGVREISALSQKEITTFIPPNNAYSSGTQKAVSDYDIPVISSMGINRFDFDVSTYDFDKNIPIQAERVVSECTLVWNIEQECIIMLHPQDFATKGELDKEKYKEYLKLLQMLQRNNIDVRRFEDIVNTR